MNIQTCIRLLWQIPVIIFICILFIPDIPWFSSAIGAWPIWLLSMPFTKMLQHRLHHRKKIFNEQAVKYSQVLVFNSKREVRSPTKQGFRQAA